ncbi:8197_t:CDS:1, partial [Cetraspora pellucida]
EIIKELTTKNSIDCQTFLKYAYQNYLIDNDYSEVKEALVENIKRYKNE